MSRRGASTAATGPGFRADVQGLRAFAVLFVLLNHLCGRWLPGGFVGVDAFFVISGFLITGLLVRDADETGRVSFIGFYQRRARRILPAAVAVLLACEAAAHLVFAGSRVRQTTADLPWALGFSANIHFAHIGTDYFQATRPPSLVQHFWSLAVEEQFYLAWPVLLLAVYALARRLRPGLAARRPLLVVLLVGTAASFGWAVHLSHSAPTDAYFSTFSRAWELGVGALLAVGLQVLPRAAGSLGRWAGPAQLLGVCALVASAFVVPSDHGFPAPWAALPVLSAALVIYAGSGGPVGWWAWPLVNPVSRYVGLVSYSLYLWHWPTILVSQALVPTTAWVFYPMTLLATAALAVSSYHFIESPFHHASRNRPARRDPRVPLRAAIATVTAVVAVVALYAARPAQPTPDFFSSGTPDGSTTTSHGAVHPASPSHAAQITAALRATSWPRLSPSLDSPELAGELQRQNGTCINPPTLTDLHVCTSGSLSSKRRALVVGDSISTSWLPAVRAALRPSGYVVHGVALSNCPFAAVEVTWPATPSEATTCNAAHAAIYRQIARFKPTLLIVSDATSSIERLASGARGRKARAAWVTGFERAIRASRVGSARVVVLAAPPPGGDDTACHTATSTPAACVTKVPADWYGKRQADLAAARAVGARYVDDSLWFCSARGFCPLFAGHLPIRSDTHHLANGYAEELAPEVRQAVG